MSRIIKNSNELSELEAYTLVNEEWLGDVGGLGLVFRHNRSGARIAVISSSDDNKVFAIGFRTPPADNTGVAHIIEHTVLCGSEKYPVKDPFISLAKSSLNTFLNAMTYPDKTVYPVASCNDKDFSNLVDVYLDAVFNPNIYRYEEIFKQEGWHYELDKPEGALTINGIVYSEMKGAYSSPEAYLERGIFGSLYPDTPYANESGGYPDDIPSLTYENYLDFHRRYYHPSNSYVYLYGNMDIEEYLTMLDEKYLGKYEKLEIDSSIPLQKPVGSIVVKREYPVAEGEDTSEKSYLSWNVSVGDSGDTKTMITAKLLNKVLCNSPGAPVKEALIKAGIGQDIDCSYEDELRQPYITITANNTEPEKQEAFVECIRNVLREQVEKGLNRKSLLAALNKMEFNYIEGDSGRYPKGLILGLSMLSSWLYDDTAVFDYCKLKEQYEELRTKLDSGYFEDFIRKYLLESEHELVFVLTPKPGMNTESEARLAKELAERKAALSEEEVASLVAETKALKLYQSTPSTPEELDTLPYLTRDDLKREAEPLVNEERLIDDVKVVYHDVETNGIGYFCTYFDLSSLPLELLPYAQIIARMLGEVDTEWYSYRELGDEIGISTGGFISHVFVSQSFDNPEEPAVCFSFMAKSFYANTERMLELAAEELFGSKFNDTKRIRELVTMIRSQFDSAVNNATVGLAINRASSYFSRSSYVSDLIGGIAFNDFIDTLYNDYDNREEEFLSKLQKTYSMMFCRESLTVSLGCEPGAYEDYEKAIRAFSAKLQPSRASVDGDFETCTTVEPVRKNEGFKMPGQVQYVVSAGNFFDAGYEYTGSLLVLKNIMGCEYLWNNIRVLGGAYGTGFGVSPAEGSGFFYSFRDPKLKETFDVYQKAVSFVRNFTASEKEMSNYVIGAIGALDTPKSPSAKCAYSMNNYLVGRTYEMIAKEREELIGTTADDINALAGIIEAIVNSGSFCVAGSEDKIEENRGLFMNVRKLTGISKEK